jgi:hypothetical protein
MKEKILSCLKRNSIEYREKGKNISKGFVGLNCPLCQNDLGQHLGIRLTNGSWTCWKNSSHRGKDLRYLLIKLLNCTFEEATCELGLEQTAYGYLDAIDNLFKEEEKIKVVKGGVSNLEFYPEFRDIESVGLTQRFWDYLLYRDFEESSLKKLIRRYNLLCSLIGDFKFRIIFPVFINDKLMTWTGRSIYPKADLRYRDLEIVKSVLHTKYCLYNYDHLKGGKVLFINEGVIDAIKLDYYSPPEFNATCLFTLTSRDDQSFMLYELSKLYNRLIVVLEKGAESNGIALVDSLSFIPNISFCELPDKFKDAGMMNREEVNGYVRNLNY